MEKVAIRKVMEEVKLVSLTNGVIINYGDLYELKTLEDALNVAVTIINALNQEK